MARFGKCWGTSRPARGNRGGRDDNDDSDNDSDAGTGGAGAGGKGKRRRKAAQSKNRGAKSANASGNASAGTSDPSVSTPQKRTSEGKSLSDSKSKVANKSSKFAPSEQQRYIFDVNKLLRLGQEFTRDMATEHGLFDADADKIKKCHLALSAKITDDNAYKLIQPCSVFWHDIDMTPGAPNVTLSEKGGEVFRASFGLVPHLSAGSEVARAIKAIRSCALIVISKYHFCCNQHTFKTNSNNERQLKSKICILQFVLGEFGDLLTYALASAKEFLGSATEFLGPATEFLSSATEFLGSATEFLGPAKKFLG